MVTALLFALSFVLLAVKPENLALYWHEVPSWKALWNLLTYQVGHANFDHFIGNFSFLLPYGLYLEHKLGWKKYLVLYVLSGLGAAALQGSVVGGIGMIGSSGSAFGVFVAAVLCFKGKLWQRLAGSALLGFVVGGQLHSAFTDPFPFVAYWGHLGGAAAGALVLFCFKAKEEPR